MWIWLGIASMVLLGVYDLCKKHAVRENAVLPILFFSNLAGLLVTFPFIAGSVLAPQTMVDLGVYVAPLSLPAHGALMLKSFIVGTSWVCAFFALKHLPISIVSPIRASGPVWTLLGALFLFHEEPSRMQWIGLAVIFVSYFAFSWVGREEGIYFHRSRWIWLIFLATLIGTCSTLLDKWLLQRQGFDVMQVVVWYSLYLFVYFAVMNALLWWPKRGQYAPFVWRWSVPCIGILLVLSDWVYFRGLSDPEALVVIMSVLRRCSVLVSFFVGAHLFKEVNKRKKAVILLGVLAGVLLIVLSR
jgi:bacterial/archaeal transporter family protein